MSQFVLPCCELRCGVVDMMGWSDGVLLEVDMDSDCWTLNSSSTNTTMA